MKRFFLFCAILVLGFSCSNNKASKAVKASILPVINKTRIEKEITNVMNQQASDWNRGDLKAFMDGYWKSDSLMFIGGSGLTYGWQKTLEGYEKGYPDLDAIGKLTFSELAFTPIDPENCFVVGKWYLTKKTKDRGGYYSLFWKKIKGKWRIIADHTSEDKKIGEKTKEAS